MRIRLKVQNKVAKNNSTDLLSYFDIKIIDKPLKARNSNGVGSNSRSSSLGDSNARFGGLDLYSMSTFSPLNYGLSGAGLLFTSTMGGNWFQCPVGILS